MAAAAHEAPSQRRKPARWLQCYSRAFKSPAAAVQEPRTDGTSKVETAKQPSPTAPGPQRPKYLERAAAAAAVVVLASAASYAAIVHFSADGPKPGPVSTATATAAPTPMPAAPPVVLTSPPATAPAAPPIHTPAVETTVATPQSSCLAQVVQARSASGGVGGVFVPVAIRPNLLDASAIRTFAVSPTGGVIATAGDDGLIRFWDASSFKLIRTLKGHTAAVYAIDYWTDGTLLASASLDGTVRVWNPADGSNTRTFDTRSIGDGNGVPSKQFSVAFDPERSLKYLASGGEDGIVRIWNYQTGALERKRDQRIAEPDKKTIRSLSFAPNGSGDFVTGGYDGKIGSI
jgi:hypothetical protein